jgi:hypothetical protein
MMKRSKDPETKADCLDGVIPDSIFSLLITAGAWGTQGGTSSAVCPLPGNTRRVSMINSVREVRNICFSNHST